MKDHKDMTEFAASEGCSKRLWVMLALSDDDGWEEGRQLPRGLGFHLSQCSTCRKLADDLLSVSAGLASLRETPLSVDLTEMASERIRTALAGGAQFTGRVIIPFDEDDGTDRVYARSGARLRRFAVAAAIFIVAGTIGFSMLGRSDRGSEIAIRSIPANSPDSGSTWKAAAGNHEKAAAENLTASRIAAVGRASGTNAEFIGPPSPRGGRRFETYDEAALSDNPNWIPMAFPVRDPDQTDLEWLRWFDKSLPAGSNPPQSDPH